MAFLLCFEQAFGFLKAGSFICLCLLRQYSNDLQDKHGKVFTYHYPEHLQV